MSDLFSTLSVAARALEAQRFGLDVTGQNISNVNTPGFTRRTADLAAVPPSGSQVAGRGVEIQGVRAIRDALIERRLQGDISDRDRYAATADILAQVESVIGLPGQSIDAEMVRFFDAFARLAQNPTDPTARQEVLLEGQAMAASFRTMAADLDQARLGADTYIRHHVDAVNELAARIATINGDMSKVPADQDALHERDNVIQAINELAEHLDVVVVERSDNQRAFDVYFGNGHPLVVGTTAYSIAAVPTGPGGFVDLQHQGVSITNEISGGHLAGYVRARDVLIPNYLASLDQVAFTMAQQVNTLHDAGFDLNGIDAGNFFTPIGAVTGAAAAITVDPTLASDLNLIAAASVPAAGDNQVARAISDLRDQRVLNGGTSTFNDAWGQLAFLVGREASTANDTFQARSEAALQTQAARDSVSAVSLDEEALQLTKFQRAYEANAVLFRTINESIDTLMRMVGV